MAWGFFVGKSFMAPDLRHTGFPDLFGVLFGQRVGGGVCGRGPASQGLAGDGSRCERKRGETIRLCPVSLPPHFSRHTSTLREALGVRTVAGKQNGAAIMTSTGVQGW